MVIADKSKSDINENLEIMTAKINRENIALEKGVTTKFCNPRPIMKTIFLIIIICFLIPCCIKRVTLCQPQKHCCNVE